jgi:hypothetical protein
MRTYICPNCYHLNSAYGLTCKRCKTLLGEVPETIISRKEAKELQEMLYNRHKYEIVEFLKKEYDTKKICDCDAELDGVDVQLPYKIHYLKRRIIGISLICLVGLGVVFWEVMNPNDAIKVNNWHLISQSILVGLKVFVPIIFIWGGAGSLGLWPKDLEINQLYFKIGSKEIPWHKIHRIGFVQDESNGNKRVVLEIWYDQHPEVYRLKINENKETLKLRRVLEGMAIKNNCAYYLDLI